jgi:hypothetical protein
MTAVRRELRRRRRPIGLTAMLVALTAVLVFAIGAQSGSLPGSTFEIDGVNPTNATGSNLKVDAQSGTIDWASVNEPRRDDAQTGQNDDSYQGGVKEDTACPGETTGSIPNNKSDLKTFGAYTEGEANGPGFLNLFWVRVNNPSGTTLMDFELNQSGVSCATGPNKVRTVGDLLIEYAIDQGGAVATISARTWAGSAWGPTIPLPGQAIGTINLVSIPAAESDGLSTTPLAARTFGEMSLDLDFIFDENSCQSFGSAMLKSRSSDAFSSQLKDFIRPVPVNITNCGSVIIRKQTDPDEDPNATIFGYTKSFSTDPSSQNTFTLMDDGVKTFNNVLIGDDYTVVEDVVPSGWDLDHIDCSASTGVTPGTNGATITFDIDNASDVVDCTYYNKARGTIIVEKITDDGFGPFDFTSGTLTPSPFTLTTTAAGNGGKASRTFANLTPGTYDVAESATAGWHIVGTPSCSDPSNNSTPAAINLAGGETVTCTFHNARDRGAIDITKLRKHAASGPGEWPQQGVTFTVTGGGLPAAGVTAVTDANGHACVGNLVLSSFVGNYTVTETVPGGYHNVGGLSQVKTVSVAATCAAGTRPLATFHNIPLTDVTVTVDSQVDGGTASDIDCDDGTSGSTGANGDGSVTVEDLEPTAPAVTLTCTITIDP